MFSRIKTRHIAIVGAVGLLMSFQNCSETLPMSSQQMLQNEEATMPFAYEATVDTIAYMSCDRLPSTFDTNSYFTFRAGAFNSGAGLSLTSTFAQQTQYMLSTVRAQLFGQSTVNAGRFLQLAIRQIGSYQNVLSGTGTVTPGVDTNNFLMELDLNPIASQLGALASGEWQNYFTGSSFDYANQSGSMWQSIDFVESETTAGSVRTSLQDRNSLVALTYTGTPAAGDTSAYGPYGTIATQVYGTGYLINFQNPPGWSLSDERVLSSVAEMDLGGGTLTQPQAWTCPSTMDFMIIQPSDVFPVGNIICNEGPDPAPSSLDATDLAAYTALRNVLPAADWYVDMTHRCLVPVPSAPSALVSCYGDRSTLGPLVYTASSGTSAACTPFNESTGAISNCPHWVSICVRQ